jgi:hypothetical protein
MENGKKISNQKNILSNINKNTNTNNGKANFFGKYNSNANNNKK